ncbi:MAG: outer membrane protein transport protein, partial [Deltaproteobacteria bacterium]|nr:outer membrane protein transport protein [Deltaproteobacteria bacterium]
GGIEGSKFGAGFFLTKNSLKINGKDAEPEWISSFELGLTAPVIKERLFAFAAVSIPYDGLYEIKSKEITEPDFVFLSERNKRLVLLAGLSVKVSDNFSLGAGFSLLPDVIGGVNVDFASANPQNSHTVDVNYNLAPVLGAMFSAKSLKIGLAYRGAQHTEIKIPVKTVISDKILPINLEVSSSAYSTPHQFALGIYHELLENLVWAFDVTYYRFSDFTQASPSVYLFDSGGAVIQSSEVGEGDFSDVFVPRLGIEYSTDKFAVRGGYSYFRSPVPRQTGAANMLDSDRNTLSIGSGFSLDRIFGFTIPVEVNLHVQFSFLNRNEDGKELFFPENPGFPAIQSEGYFINAGMNVEVGL